MPTAPGRSPGDGSSRRPASGRSPTAGNEWREHLGTRYLHVTYGPDPAVASAVAAESTAIVAAEPDGGTVRVLVDLRGASLTGWSRESMAVGRRDAAAVARRMKLRCAVVGARGPLAALLRGMSMVSSNVQFVPAPSLDKALEFLVRE